jgi:hypothetical protein
MPPKPPNDELYTDPGPCEKPIDATPDEVEASLKVRAEMALLQEKRELARAQLKAAEAEVKALFDNCPHTTFYDVDVNPWFHRYCGGCGKHLETL